MFSMQIAPLAVAPALAEALFGLFYSLDDLDQHHKREEKN